MTNPNAYIEQFLLEVPDDTDFFAIYKTRNGSVCGIPVAVYRTREGIRKDFARVVKEIDPMFGINVGFGTFDDPR